MTVSLQRHDCCITGNQRHSKKLLAEHFEGLEEDEEEEEAGAEEEAEEEEEEGSAGSEDDLDDSPDQNRKVSA